MQVAITQEARVAIASALSEVDKGSELRTKKRIKQCLGFDEDFDTTPVPSVYWDAASETPTRIPSKVRDTTRLMTVVLNHIDATSLSEMFQVSYEEAEAMRTDVLNRIKAGKKAAFEFYTNMDDARWVRNLLEKREKVPSAFQDGHLAAVDALSDAIAAETKE